MPARKTPARRERKPAVSTEGFNTHSSPSDLKITDMRIAVVGHANWRWPIIRLYTNQGLVGLGEVRDGVLAMMRGGGTGG